MQPQQVRVSTAGIQPHAVVDEGTMPDPDHQVALARDKVEPAVRVVSTQVSIHHQSTDGLHHHVVVAGLFAADRPARSGLSSPETGVVGKCDLVGGELFPESGVDAASVEVFGEVSREREQLLVEVGGQAVDGRCQPGIETQAQLAAVFGRQPAQDRQQRHGEERQHGQRPPASRKQQLAGLDGVLLRKRHPVPVLGVEAGEHRRDQRRRSQLADAQQRQQRQPHQHRHVTRIGTTSIQKQRDSGRDQDQQAGDHVEVQPAPVAPVTLVVDDRGQRVVLQAVHRDRLVQQQHVVGPQGRVLGAVEHQRGQQRVDVERVEQARQRHASGDLPVELPLRGTTQAGAVLASTQPLTEAVQQQDQQADPGTGVEVDPHQLHSDQPPQVARPTRKSKAVQQPQLERQPQQSDRFGAGHELGKHRQQGHRGQHRIPPVGQAGPRNVDQQPQGQPRHRRGEQSQAQVLARQSVQPGQDQVGAPAQVDPGSLGGCQAEDVGRGWEQAVGGHVLAAGSALQGGRLVDPVTAQQDRQQHDGPAEHEVAPFGLLRHQFRCQRLVLGQIVVVVLGFGATLGIRLFGRRRIGFGVGFRVDRGLVAGLVGCVCRVLNVLSLQRLALGRLA